MSAPLPASFRRLLVGPVLSQEPQARDPKYSLPPGEAVKCSQCGSLPGQDGGDDSRYVSRVDPSIVLCSTCFGNGRLPLLMVADDFVVARGSAAAAAAASSSSSSAFPPSVSIGAPSSSSSSSSSLLQGAAAGGVGTGEWKAEDSLRLLEALAVHGEDWDAVAEQVGGGKSRGRSPIIAHRTHPAQHHDWLASLTAVLPLSLLSVCEQRSAVCTFCLCPSKIRS